MAQLPVGEFLSKFGNQAAFALYAMGDAGDDLCKALSDLPKHWKLDCGLARFERDVAVLLADEAQLSDIRSEVAGAYEFLDILKSDAFERFGVPSNTAIGHGLLIRQKPQLSDTSAYEAEMVEMERRTGQLQDRRIRQLDRRIGDMEKLVEELRDKRREAYDAWKTSGVGDRRNADDRRRGADDRRDIDGKPNTERRWDEDNKTN